jgi:hypothetical protein
MAEPVHFIIVLPPLGFGFIRDSPDGCRSDLNIRAFAAFLQDKSEVWSATVILGNTNDRRGVDLAIFAGIWTHSSRRLLVNA